MGASATVAPSDPGAKASAGPVIKNRFINASAEHTEPFYDSGNVTLGAAQTELANIDVPASGYLASILVDVEVTSSGNSAAVAAREDAPWNVIASVRHSDINGANLFGPMSGFDWYLAHKYGGYAFDTDPVRGPNYSAVVAGAGATGGTTRWQMRLPVQVNPRDAYGALPNMNAASTFKLFFTLNTLGNIYSTSPNGTVVARIRCTLESWLVPGAVDVAGVSNEQMPPGLGSYQRWVKNSFNIAAGDNTLRLPNVSNMIRSLVAVFRTTAPARNDASFPSLVQLNVDGYARFNNTSRVVRQHMWERTGFTGTQIDTGVYVWDWTHELDGKMGFETRELWLPTNSATRLELVGNFGVAGTLDVLTNDVVTVGDYRAA